MSMEQLFRLARTTTVGQLLERDDFAKRLAASTPISVLELLYPLLQGYDSVAIRADVELGGTDQKFNLLLGRDIQRAYGVPEQAILTMPLLPGTDGVRRMAKSLGNYIGVTEPPEEIYGKTLSIPDAALETWYQLLLGTGRRRSSARATPSARWPGRWWPGSTGTDAGAGGRAGVRPRSHRPQAPDEMPTVTWPAAEPEVHLPALLERAFGISRSEARRSLAQGGVKLDGEPVGDGALDLPAAEVDGKVLQLGKRRFARVRVE